MNWPKTLASLLISLLIVLVSWSLYRHMTAPPAVVVPIDRPNRKDGGEDEKEKKRRPLLPWRAEENIP